MKPRLDKTVDPGVEGVGAVYILEYLRTWIFLEASSITHHLGYLPPGDLVPRLERAVSIPGDDASTCQTPDVGVEGAV